MSVGLECSSRDLSEFRATVLDRGAELYRDLPWRRTHDPYEIWISEVMLQQTQTARVDGRWQRWLQRFPHRLGPCGGRAGGGARGVAGDGVQPPCPRAAPGRAGDSRGRRRAALGRARPRGASRHRPATAAGIRAFAFDLPGVYLETNVRAVFLHELFPGEEGVSDRELVPLVRATCPADASDPDDDPRTWYYALLDYGAYLKRTVPNPSRRSSGHARQSRFEGSHRQKRAELVRILLAHRGDAPGGVDLGTVAAELASAEEKAGRRGVKTADVRALLEELAREGFCREEAGGWRV